MVGSHLDITRSKNAEDAVRTNTAKLIAAQRIQEHLLPRAAPVIDGFDILIRVTTGSEERHPRWPKTFWSS